MPHGRGPANMDLEMLWRGLHEPKPSTLRIWVRGCIETLAVGAGREGSRRSRGIDSGNLPGDRVLRISCPSCQVGARRAVK